MIRCEKLVKRYGRTLALDSLDLTVGKGELHGFIGPNGAGKTTAMKILATLARPTGGAAFVGGVNVCEQPQRARALVGYMPDFFGVYDNLKAWEYLDLYASCVGMDFAARRRRIDELLSLTALTDKREAYVDGLSRGMKQRLCLARALLHDPQLLILDEPASGMDPRARAQMRDILREIGRMGKTVLISSHILPELSELCDAMTILEKGRVVFSGSAQEMRRKLSGEASILVRFAQAPEGEIERQAREEIAALCGGAQPEREADGAWRVCAGEDAERDARLLARLLALGAPVCEFSRQRATLETVFMEVTGGESENEHESHL